MVAPVTSTSAVSDKKRRANRRNARKSTGPRTLEGKARSSRNATTHGLFCGQTVLPGESKYEFLVMREELIASHNPKDLMELHLVDRIVVAMWKLKRIQSAEREVYAWQEQNVPQVICSLDLRKALSEGAHLQAGYLMAINLDSASPALKFLAQYEQQLERSISRSLRDLQKLQKLRRDRQQNGDWMEDEEPSPYHGEIDDADLEEENQENEPTEEEANATDGRAGDSEQPREQPEEPSSRDTGFQPVLGARPSADPDVSGSQSELAPPRTG